MNVPRPEHPKPHFVRQRWQSLNGLWKYEREHGRVPSVDTGYGYGDLEAHGGRSTGAVDIVVPFTPESPLSGLGETDLVSKQRYSRLVEIPAAWTGDRVILHFGAVYYYAKVFVDDRLAGFHAGGSVSFSFDITELVTPGGSHRLVVEVLNNIWDGSQPSGKHAWKERSYGCNYTRTTGIWQSVWMEAVHPLGLADVHVLPDLDEGAFTFIPEYRSVQSGARLRVTLRDGDEVVGSGERSAVDGAALTVAVNAPKAWSPESPHLYDVTYEVIDPSGSVVDRVASYSGLRKIHIEGNRFFLNNTPYFLRLVLDQGFYPDGNWTAPSDAALRRDIELAKDAGFNGARLHQKVFEERFLYWADRLGYLVWGESASWGLEYYREGLPPRNFLSEWREIVRRDRNHPSIVAWTPFNETRLFLGPVAHKRVHEDAYHICKSLDPTRPVNDASGYIHHLTDLYTVHRYEQDPKALHELMSDQPGRGVFRNYPDHDAPYRGQPYYVDEFGGIKWNPKTQTAAGMNEGQNLASWGYGRAPESVDEFYDRLQRLVKALNDVPHIAGWCYTQLTDVEQEQNGIYFYDRAEKFDMARVREIFRMKKAGYDN